MFFNINLYYERSYCGSKHLSYLVCRVKRPCDLSALLNKMHCLIYLLLEVHLFRLEFFYPLCQSFDGAEESDSQSRVVYP